MLISVDAFTYFVDDIGRYLEFILSAMDSVIIFALLVDTYRRL